MANTEQKRQYNEYLVDHIDNVKKAYDWLCINLPEVIPTDIKDKIDVAIYNHDNSKYSEEEYEAYADYFYGTKSKAVEDAFNQAWNHHQKNNKHHWQYWVLIGDDFPIKLMEMPYEYIIEMICDWWAFSFKKGNLREIFNWYKSKEQKISLNRETKKTVKDLLKKIEKKLDELDKAEETEK